MSRLRPSPRLEAYAMSRPSALRLGSVVKPGSNVKGTLGPRDSAAPGMGVSARHNTAAAPRALSTMPTTGRTIQCHRLSPTGCILVSPRSSRLPRNSWAGRMEGGPSTSSTSTRGRAGRRGRSPLRRCSPPAGRVDSTRVLVGHRQRGRARGAARGRPRAAALLPLRLVTHVNAGAETPA